ncbi:MAG: DUF3772 domain-containing protein [Filomicrobium sp.]
MSIRLLPYLLRIFATLLVGAFLATTAIAQDTGVVGNGSVAADAGKTEPNEADGASKSRLPTDKPGAPVAQRKDALQLNVNPAVAKVIDDARGLADSLTLLEKTVERVKDREDELTQQLPFADSILDAAGEKATLLEPALADIKSQISRLGPAPEGTATEPDAIANERARLNATADEIDAAIKTAELTQVRARQLSARIQTLRLDRFRQSLLQRSPSLFSPALWGETLSEVPRAVTQLRTIFANWFARVRSQFGNVLGVLAAAFVVGLVLQMASRRIRRKLRDQTTDAVPPFSRRVLVAGLEAVLRMLPKIAVAAVIYAGLASLSLLYLQVGGLAVAAYKAVAILAGGRAFATAYLQPARPAWRVFAIEDSAARQLRQVIRLTATVFALDVVMRAVIIELYLPLAFSVAWTAIASVIFALVFYRALKIDVLLSEEVGPRVAFLAQHAHKFPLALAIAIIAIGLALGYVALAHFVATRLLIVGTAIFLLVAVYLANRAIAREPDEAHSVATSIDSTIPIEVRRRLARGLSIVLDIALFLLAIPFLLLAIGFAPAEIATLSNRALFGFEVGGVEISLAEIGIAIAIAATILFLARMLQRWLGETVLHPTRTEPGLGNSIRTGVGYIGFIVAVLAGLSYAGLDITNLAIVAGALSVGIGFGLQSIVNNFVSGLILLVERPINVGDWIKVAGVQGHVRRISVRSTEIETFERASVIIPNSELITGTVTNLTLRNALGRVTIPVGVSYDSDPDLVQRLLMEAADESELVARHPAPFVVFENFANSSLDFSLRIYVPDVSSSLSTQTDVRKRILSKFREHNIEIPFPQHDLNVKSVEGMSQWPEDFGAMQADPPVEKGGGASKPKSPSD